MSRRLKILFVSGWCPYPLDNGSRVRQYYLLRHLAEQHDVTLFTFLPSEEWRSSLPILETFCCKAVGVPSRPYRARSAQSFMGVLSPLPRAIISTFSKEMNSLIYQETAFGDYDVLIAGEIGQALYVHASKAKTTLVDDIEATSLYDQLRPNQKLLSRARHSLTRVKYERFVRETLGRCVGCTVVSQGERELVAPLVSRHFPIEIIPNGVDTLHNTVAFAETRSNVLVFSGSLHYPANMDAVDFFLRGVYPRIRAKVPDVTLTVTGHHARALPGTEELRSGVTFTGFVEDVRPFVGRSAVAVVPLRHGAGTRLKVLEAMALGVPVVSTSKGVEGLEVMSGRDVLVADKPDAFADAVVGLLNDKHLRETLVKNARTLVETRYDWRVICAKLEDFLQELIALREKHT